MTTSLARAAIALLGGGLAWALHLLASYVVIALACARGWTHARPALIALTLVAVATAVGVGWVSQSRPPSAAFAADADRPVPFVRQLGVALSALFLFLIVLGGVVPMMAPLCALAP